MKYIGEVEGKHGKFSFFHYDEYIGLSLREYGEYSEIELSFILNFIKIGDAVFDIGANIGAFTVPISQKVQKTGQVLAFEPQIEIFKLLTRNIKNNELQNVSLHNFGLGLENKTVFIEKIDYSKVGNFGGVSLVYDNKSFIQILKNKEKEKIKVSNLDSFLNIKKCDFIKMDIELMEFEALKGGIKLIKKFRPIMWIENHRKYPNQINKLLINEEYKLFWVTTRLYNDDNYFLNTNNYYSDSFTFNILCIPSEKVKNFEVDFLDRIADEYSKPEKLFTKSL